MVLGVRVKFRVKVKTTVWLRLGLGIRSGLVCG